MTQRLALQKAYRTARIARFTSCRTVFTEWHTSATQSSLSTHRRLGFGILIDWANSMRKPNFIGMCHKLIYPDHFQSEQSHIIYGYHHPPKKVIQQSFNLILAIQQVTNNSTWFAASCIRKIRSMQAKRGHSKRRHIQIQNSPASIIAAVARGCAVRHSFERQINGRTPQPGLTIPLDPEIASLIDELSSIGVLVQQVVVPPRNRRSQSKVTHVNATRLVLT